MAGVLQGSEVNRPVDAVDVLGAGTFAESVAPIGRDVARHGIGSDCFFGCDANAIPAEALDAVPVPGDMMPAHQSSVLEAVAAAAVHRLRRGLR